MHRFLEKHECLCICSSGAKYQKSTLACPLKSGSTRQFHMILPKVALCSGSSHKRYDQGVIKPSNTLHKCELCHHKTRGTTVPAAPQENTKNKVGTSEVRQKPPQSIITGKGYRRK